MEWKSTIDDHRARTNTTTDHTTLATTIQASAHPPPTYFMLHLSEIKSLSKHKFKTFV